MAAGSKAREIVNYAFLVALADDGLIDDGELTYIKSLALADGALDEDERTALRRVLSLVEEKNLSPVAQAEFRRFRSQHAL